MFKSLMSSQKWNKIQCLHFQVSWLNKVRRKHEHHSHPRGLRNVFFVIAHQNLKKRKKAALYMINNYHQYRDQRRDYADSTRDTELSCVFLSSIN